MHDDFPPMHRQQLHHLLIALALASHLLTPASGIVLRKRLPADLGNTPLEIRFEYNVTVVNSTDGSVVRSMLDTCNVHGMPCVEELLAYHHAQ